MKAKSYSEKLLDPRWQKRRLEMLSAKEWQCENCGDTSSCLHVHHKAYIKNKSPWEYDNDQLAVLCETCHKSHHENEVEWLQVISRIPIDGPSCLEHVKFLVAGFTGQMIAGIGDSSLNARLWHLGYSISTNYWIQDGADKND